ncbi:hypothetical protein [Sphingobacterium cavernae]|jgi:hypothetical protein|uniref:hypothetical protein n=1 Tax=Sphingobacterium cavernae TaxID=2592657 RepID=UPI00122FE7DC|nr:hypothetical protein [Sphingobacterium cavernae]
MAKKKYYSKPLSFFWKELYGIQKKLTPEFSDEQIHFVLKRNLLSNQLAPDETLDMRSLTITGLDLWRDDSKGDLLHLFFLERELRHFLETTVLADLDSIKNYLYDNGQIRNITYIYSNEIKETFVFKFALHVPFDGEGYAFTLNIEDDGSLTLYYTFGKIYGLMSDKFYKEIIKKEDEISKTHSRIFRLAINTIAYMNCFPNCVSDGVPNDYVDYSENKLAKNLTIQVSDKITEDNSTISKIPHFRRGHFRVLKSEYFKNKKGQIVFISETMVKGKAKTVAMSDEIDKYNTELIDNLE